MAFYVGHNAIRREVMGEERGVPSPEQLEAMKTQVRKGMEMGAVGFSTGLMYPPGMFSATAEIAALASEVAPFGGIYDSHVRNPVHAFVGSHAEAIEIGRRAGIPAKLGHLKSVGLKNEGKITEVIELVEAARSAGRSVVSDQYPYDGAATSTLVPGESEVGSGILVVPPDMLAEGQEIADFDFKAALGRRVRERGLERALAIHERSDVGAVGVRECQGRLQIPDRAGLFLFHLQDVAGEQPDGELVDVSGRLDSGLDGVLGAHRDGEVFPKERRCEQRRAEEDSRDEGGP